MRGQVDAIATLNERWIKERPSYGLVTNGSEFIFLKLHHRSTPLPTHPYLHRVGDG